MDELKMKAVYDEDTKYNHRFKLKGIDGISGSIYIVKGRDIPKMISLMMMTKADVDKEGNE